ncbi:hypothetical protein [Desulfurobacterium sp.]
MNRKEILLEELRNVRTKLLIFSLSGVLFWISSGFISGNKLSSFISIAIAVFYWRKLDDLMEKFKKEIKFFFHNSNGSTCGKVTPSGVKSFC